MDAEKKGRDVTLQITRKIENIDVNLPNLKKLVETICTRFTSYETRDSSATGTRYDISIALVDDTEIRRINRQFLNRNNSTDCLSFDLSDDTGSAKSFELLINAERAIREASRRGHLAEAELALYIAHGLLHHLGFDDSTPAQAKKMHNTEDEILQQLGYGLVYNKNVKAQKRKGTRHL